MAQSSLDAWQARIDDGAPEEVPSDWCPAVLRLGVVAAIGRVFTADDDRTAALLPSSATASGSGGSVDVPTCWAPTPQNALTIMGAARRH